MIDVLLGCIWSYLSFFLEIVVFAGLYNEIRNPKINIALLMMCNVYSFEELLTWCIFSYKQLYIASWYNDYLLSLKLLSLDWIHLWNNIGAISNFILLNEKCRREFNTILSVAIETIQNIIFVTKCIIPTTRNNFTLGGKWW